MDQVARRKAWEDDFFTSDPKGRADKALQKREEHGKQSPGLYGSVR